METEGSDVYTNNFKQGEECCKYFWRLVSFWQRPGIAPQNQENGLLVNLQGTAPLDHVAFHGELYLNWPFAFLIPASGHNLIRFKRNYLDTPCKNERECRR